MQEGYAECVVMLVKRYPKLLKYMLTLTMKEDMPEEKVRKEALSSQMQTVCTHLQTWGLCSRCVLASMCVHASRPLHHIVGWCLEVCDVRTH